MFAAIMLGIGVGVPSADAQSGAPEPAGATGAAASDAGVSGAIEQKLFAVAGAADRALPRKSARTRARRRRKSFSPVIGADVPPMIELYELPDDALADVPAAKLYKYTMVQDKVVVVDPTKMRVIDVIGPERQNQASNRTARLLRRAFLPACDDRLGQHVEIGAHEKGLAAALAVIAVVGVDHGAHRRDAGRHRMRRSDRPVRPGRWRRSADRQRPHGRCIRLPSAPAAGSPRSFAAPTSSRAGG